MKLRLSALMVLLIAPVLLSNAEAKPTHVQEPRAEHSIIERVKEFLRLRAATSEGRTEQRLPSPTVRAKRIALNGLPPAALFDQAAIEVVSTQRTVSSR